MSDEEKVWKEVGHSVAMFHESIDFAPSVFDNVQMIFPDLGKAECAGGVRPEKMFEFDFTPSGKIYPRVVRLENCTILPTAHYDKLLKDSKEGFTLERLVTKEDLEAVVPGSADELQQVLFVALLHLREATLQLDKGIRVDHFDATMRQADQAIVKLIKSKR